MMIFETFKRVFKALVVIFEAFKSFYSKKSLNIMVIFKRIQKSFQVIFKDKALMVIFKDKALIVIFKAFKKLFKVFDGDN